MRKKFTPEQKITAVQDYLSGKKSLGKIARSLDTNKGVLRRWITNYQSMGEEAFQRKKNKSYSADLKLAAVQDYLSGTGSLRDICRKYKIKSEHQLRNWILLYNGHGNLKSSETGGSTIMTKGRTTTFDERVEIVQYCIAHNHNYTETAEKYSISYQQARNYTVKYETGGVQALQDNRGKRKPASEMNELEKLRAEVKLLRAQKERAEMEAAFLKKLDEIERRRG